MVVGPLASHSFPDRLLSNDWTQTIQLRMHWGAAIRTGTDRLASVNQAPGQMQYDQALWTENRFMTCPQ